MSEVLLRDWMDDERVRGALLEDHWNLLNAASSKSKQRLIKSLSPCFVEKYDNIERRQKTSCWFGQTAQAAPPQHLAMFESSRVFCQSFGQCPEWESPSSTKQQPGDCSTLLEGQEQEGLVEEEQQDLIHTRGKLTVLWCLAQGNLCGASEMSPHLFCYQYLRKPTSKGFSLEYSCNALALSFASFVCWSLGGCYFQHKGTNKKIVLLLLFNQFCWTDTGKRSQIKLFDICFSRWTERLSTSAIHVKSFIFATNGKAYFEVHLKV